MIHHIKGRAQPCTDGEFKVIGIADEQFVLSSDNGHSRWIAGIAPCDFKLEPGKEYIAVVSDMPLENPEGSTSLVGRFSGKMTKTNDDCGRAFWSDGVMLRDKRNELPIGREYYVVVYQT